MYLLAGLGTTAVDEAMVVFELRAYRRAAAVDQLMVVFESGAYRKTAAVDDSTIAVVSQAHVAARKMAVADDWKVVAESKAQVDVSVALELIQVVGQLKPAGVSSHVG